MTDLEQFTTACIEALYFTDTSNADLDPDTRLNLEADCRSFWHRFGCFVNVAECNRGSGEYTKAAQAGHDFWLTRNGHGAGFWDGDWPEPYGKMFSKASEGYGEFQTYLGDDGLIHA